MNNEDVVNFNVEVTTELCPTTGNVRDSDDRVIDKWGTLIDNLMNSTDGVLGEVLTHFFGPFITRIQLATQYTYYLHLSISFTYYFV